MNSPNATPARLRVERLEDRVNPGTGTYTVSDTGIVRFHFAVSILFQATPEELARIKESFQQGSILLNNATENQHRFGDVTFINNSSGSADAEVWIYPTGGDGRIANAPLALYGSRGAHVSIYHDNAIANTPSTLASGFVIAHEFGHFLYGLGDHYAGPNPAYTDGSDLPRDVKAYDYAQLDDLPTLDFSLMDVPWDRGDRHPKNNGTNGQYTQREFTVAGLTHDSGANTWQNAFNNNQSDWETIKKARFPITAPPPGTLPSGEQFSHTINTFDSDGHATVAIVLDRSGSMDPVRMGLAQNGARLITQFLGVVDTIGVVSFADEATTDAPLKPAFPAARSAARGVIDELVAIGGTNITSGLEAAINQITAQPQSERTPNEVIVLLTDGDNTTDTSPKTLRQKLQNAGISVFSIGIGNDLSVDGREALEFLSSYTSGVFYAANSNFELIPAFFSTAMAITGMSAISSPPLGVGVDKPKTFQHHVAADAEEAIFAMSRVDLERAVNFVLTSPTGKVYTSKSTGKVTSFEDGAVQVIRVKDPEAGLWKMSAIVPTGGEPNLVQLMSASTPGDTTITFKTMVPEALTAPNMPLPPMTMPPPIKIMAYPTYQGQPVINATVKAVVTRPDGTIVTITLRDTGSKVDGDMFIDDGEYTGEFTQFVSQGNGSYTFEIMLDTTKGQPMTGGTNMFQSPTPIVAKPVPAASVAVSNTVVVQNVPDLPGGIVTGRVFDDLNANRAFDAGEPGFESVLVYPDFNNNGERDGSEPFAFTNATGLYELEITQPGTYTIRIEKPEGETQLSDDPAPDVGGNRTVTGVDFALGDPAQLPVTDPANPNNPSNPNGPTAGRKRFVVAADRGGDTLSVRDATGGQIGTFSAFDGAGGSGVRAVLADFTGDGVPDLVVGTGAGVVNRVRILDGVNGKEIYVTTPFEPTFTGGVFVAAGDLTGDDVPELVITPDIGGGPRVLVLNGSGFGAIANFFWITELDFRGGAHAAVADLDGDGLGDLIVGAGSGGGPRVAGFGPLSSGAGGPTRMFPDFFAFEPSMRTGVFVAAGDVNGDGVAEIAVAPGAGGGPRVTVFDTLALQAGHSTTTTDFFARAPEQNGGARVAVRDLDGDGVGDLIVGTATTNRVTVYSGSQLTRTAAPPVAFEFDAIADPLSGVFVG